MKVFVVSGIRSGSSFLCDKLSQKHNLFNFGEHTSPDHLVKLQRHWTKGNVVVKLLTYTWTLPHGHEWLTSALQEADKVYYLKRDPVDRILSIIGSGVTGRGPVYTETDKVEVVIDSLDTLIQEVKSIELDHEIMDEMRGINPGEIIQAEDIFDGYPYTHNYELVNKIPGFEHLSLENVIKSQINS